MGTGMKPRRPSSPVHVEDAIPAHLYREGAQNGSVAVVVQPVDLPHLASSWVVETITEIRKANGHVWRRR